MQFRVLGPVELVAGERRAPVAHGHRRTILAVLLAARGDAVPTDHVISAVWGADPPPSARKSLQSHVSRLRGELTAANPSAAAMLATSDRGYRIALENDCLDAAEFESLIARARALRDTAPHDAVETFRSADALWRGCAFGDLAAHPNVCAEAVRLELARAAADDDRIDTMLALGRHGEMVGELEAKVMRDPLGEKAHGQLMLAHYRGGRQADALETYHRLRNRLLDELGVDPSPELREMHEKILRQDVPRPDLAGPSPPTVVNGQVPAPDDSAAPWKSPRKRASALIGRDEVVAAVTSLASAEPLVTLTGPGGVGKTRVAMQVMARARDRFGSGAVTCTLAAVRDPSAVGDALITALGIQPVGERPAAETLVAALADRHLLLLLDNCEHVSGPVAALADAVLEQCPNVHILATSRERLRLGAERVWPVGPLEVPPVGADAAQVEATAAGTLFRLRAEAVEPTFALTDANASAVAHLCRRLDGMPLAIELAAARVRAFAPEDLVRRLGQRFSLLAGGPGRDGGRHGTLQAVVGWSYDLLAAREAELFDRLSVFAGPFPVDAAEQVCAGGSIDRAEVAGLLGELVDKSMIVVERRDARVRYRLLETLREFGSGRLAASLTGDTYRRSHAAYYVALAERLGPRVRGDGERSAVAELDAAFDDLRSAHAWAVSASDVDGALRLPAALADYAFYRLRDEITTWARRAVEMPGAVGHPDFGNTLSTAAWGDTSRGECGRASRDADRALTGARPESIAAAHALCALGTAALYEGRLDEVIHTAKALQQAADVRGDPYSRTFAGVLLVLAHLYRGDQQAAAAHLAGLHDAAESSGNPTAKAFARYCHGEVHLDSRPAGATAALDDAVRLAEDVGNRLIEGVSLVSLASLRGRQGETRRAAELFRRVVAHWQRLGDYTHQLTTLRNLVVFLVQVNADETAAVLYGAAGEGSAPSFGVEAERLTAAWEALRRRLGAQRAARAADRGRQLPVAQVAEIALAEIGEVLATGMPHGFAAAEPSR